MGRIMRTPERNVLIVLLLVAGALWITTLIAGQLGDIDRAILLFFRTASNPADPVGPKWLEEYARDLTALGSVAVLLPVIAATVVFLFLTRQHSAAWMVIAATGGGMAVSSLLKNLVARPRPDAVFHSVYVSSFSFPSGHAMMAAVTYLTLGSLTAREMRSRVLKAYVMAIAVIVAILVGTSRVYLGVHWPSDVLGGWCLGAAWALVCWTTAEWFDHRHRGSRHPI